MEKGSTTFLSTSPGRVVALGNKAVTASIRLEAFGNFEVVRSIVTQVAVSSELSVQFQNMLGGNIFVYVFGEKPGALMLRGIAMESGCEDEDGEVRGIKELHEFYRYENAYARKTPLKLTIGTDLTIVAYMIGMNYSVADPKLRLWEYNLRLVTVPESAIDAERRATPTDDSDAEDEEEPISLAGPALPPISLTQTADTGGSDFSDSFSPLTEGSGYSAYGTGPRLNLVEAQS